MARWNKIGSVNDSKYGGYTFVISKDCELKEGERLTLIKPADNIQSLADKGIITQEQADEKLEKLPDFVKYEVFQVPPKE